MTEKSKLTDAVREGLAMRERAAESFRRDELKRVEEERRQFERQYEAWKLKLVTDDWIYERIKEAVATGQDSLTLHGDRACEKAVRELPGLAAQYYSETGHFNSDEIVETFERVVVTWPGAKS